MEGNVPVPKLVGIESQIRTDSSKYNDGTKQMQQFHEEKNSVENYQNIIAAYKSGRARDISDESKAPLFNDEKMPCIIIGSGPSLDYSIKFMKEWKGGIMCTTSHALTLMHEGIEPTHIVALDCFSTWEEIAGVDWSKTRTKLVAHPGIYPSLIENWPNEMLMYIENNGHPDSFYATTQKRMYSHREGDLRLPTFVFYIRTEVTLFACSPPTQLFVADILEYGNIFLCGCDFGYHSDKQRFTSWSKDKDNNWVEEVHPFILEKEKEDLIECNNGLYTHPIHLYYKKNFLSAWRLCCKTIYTTDKGIITEIPYMDMKKVLECQGYKLKQQGIPYIAEKSEEYLATVGAYIIETNKGLSFIESANPLAELSQFMQQVNRRYACNQCGIRLNADNDNPKESELKCPKCVGGQLQREVEVDIESNMRRILARMDKVPKLHKPIINIDMQKQALQLP
jgi:DNA-directed RNA polymerase subunit RPC12/RpoP